MEAIQDWGSYLLRNGYLTPGIFGPLNTLQSLIHKYLIPSISKLIEKPDLATIALTLVILFLSLKILNMLVQTVLFWVRLAFRIAFWGGLVMLAFYISTRGIDGAAEDVGYWTKYWTNEYNSLKHQAESASAAQRGGYKVGASKKQWPW